MSYQEPIRKKNFSPLSRKSAPNPLQRRRFKVPKPQKPVVRRSPEEQRAFLQQKLDQSAFVGYNGLNVPVNVPQTPPSQPVVPEENVSQNPESPEKEVEGEAVTSSEPSAAESENNPSQKPNLQAQLERVSRLSSNLLNIPNTQGKESPPVQRNVLQDGLEQYHPKIEQRTHSVFNGLNRFNVQPSSQPETVQRSCSACEQEKKEEEEKHTGTIQAKADIAGARDWNKNPLS
ncbi:MAG: hypothetical protein RLP97_15185, partial [Coleofasciculus chthonoplastes F2-STO-03]